MERPDEQRLSWLFLYNKKATISGLVFLFLTFTALSLVDRFYFAADYYSKLPTPTATPFGWDSCFRLLFLPLANLLAIGLLCRYKGKSSNYLSWVSSVILLLTMLSLVFSGVTQTYYSANDYTWEVVALIVFTFTMFGMPFRVSFFISFIMMLSGLAFLLFDKVEQRVVIYNTTFLLSIWFAMIVGALRKAELRRENYKTVNLLHNYTLELDAKAKELSQKNQELQQFAYASSHDLQEPLRTISSFVAILERRLSGQLTDDLKTYMGYIQKSTERMKHLIQAILEYSHIGRNLKLEAVNCQELLELIVDDLNYSITNAGAAIHFVNMPTISCYKTEFSMLMQNLIGNAIKFRKQGVAPVVSITYTDEGEAHHFTVTDNGIGIEVKHLEKVFALFGRLHTKDEYEGAGIGLAHCRKIVEIHGGNIWVESQPGTGSNFHFTISKKLNQIANETNAQLHHAH
ncbi:MAG: hypothetical protein IT258_20225 [Saprospiraceae bacterium]|nr:hypothetical protein [Saprospiraceae bacterium]